MTPLQMWRLTIAIVGVLVFLWGIKIQDETVRLVGIAFLVVALALRFLGRSRRR